MNALDTTHDDLTMFLLDTWHRTVATDRKRLNALDRLPRRFRPADPNKPVDPAWITDPREDAIATGEPGHIAPYAVWARK
mgnify:CR=1 FL=1